MLENEEAALIYVQQNNELCKLSVTFTKKNLGHKYKDISEGEPTHRQSTHSEEKSRPERLFHLCKRKRFVQHKSPVKNTGIVKSLYDTTQDFIVANVSCIESLVGFPEVIGLKIFEHAVNSNVFKKLPAAECTRALKIFQEAYPSVRLDSFKHHVDLLSSQYREPLEVLLRGVTKLDMTNYYIHNDTKMIAVIQQLPELEELNLTQTSLDDEDLRLLAMSGFLRKNLRVLNIAGNMDLSPRSSRWLRKFLSIQQFVLPDSEAMKSVVLTLKCNSFESGDPLSQVQSVVTSGLAAGIVEKWQEELQKTSTKFNTFYKPKRPRLCKTDVVNSVTLIRAPAVQRDEPPTKLSNVLPVATKEDYEWMQDYL